jgi:hypothetical protein
MFRLIQLHARHGIPRIGMDPDGFATEPAALARFRESATTHFGVGRFDIEGRLAEVIMDTVCPTADCANPAAVVHAQTFQRLCDTCAFGLEVLTVPQLAARLGVAVRLTPVLAPSGRHAAPEEGSSVSNRIAREFAANVSDPAWRRELCSELGRNPTSLNGLLIGVGALSHRDVLDLYPALCTLGSQLPVHVHADLMRASVRPLSPAGVAALRLGI